MADSINPKAPPAMNALNTAYMKEKKSSVSEDKLREVAKLYEKQFMREMVKNMRATVQESGFVKVNNAERIFRDQLDDQYTDKWSENGGVGFSDIIYDQLMEKFGAQFGLKAPVEKPKGPIGLEHTQAVSVRRIPTQSPNQITNQVSLDNVQGKPVEIKSPWSGTLLEKIELGPENHVVSIRHDNGLQSRIQFQGRAQILKDVQVGSAVSEGQNIGLLSPDQRQLVWDIKKNISE